jgi:uncharacterized protein YecT (DUF1311 family)
MLRGFTIFMKLSKLPLSTFVGVIAVAGLTPVMAGTPSFDCAAASSAVDVLICSSKYLSTLDIELASIYRYDMTRATNQHRLLMSQRAWLRSRPSVCSVPSKDVPPHGIRRFRTLLCLAGLYDARLATLYAIRDRLTSAVTAAPPDVRVDTVTADGKSAVVADFQRNIQTLYSSGALHVESCNKTLSYVGGGALGGHDSSFGAQCTVDINGRPLGVLMCDDWLVGKWHIAESRSDIDRTRLTQFIGKYCPPGG